MPRRNYILEQWNDFSRKVLPQGCSEIQRIETCRAFFAGAFALWHIVFKNLSPESDPTPQDITMLDDLAAEFKQHAEALRAGTR